MKTEKLHFLPSIVLVAGILVFFLGWLFIPQEFISSDPWAYSKIAYGVASNGDFGSSHVFNHRLGVVLPVAIAYSISGVTIHTTNFWPLIVAVILMIVIWLALPTTKSKIIGVLLSIVSVPLWKFSTSLYPDLIAAGFMALSVYFLVNRASGDGRKTRTVAIGILGVTSLFMAFLAKESAYWVLPLWLLAFYEDYRKGALSSYYWRTVIISGILIGISYLAFCGLVFGDSWARFRAVESLTGVHLWAWDNSSAKDLIKRLVTQPLGLYYSFYGVAFYIAIAATIFAPDSLRYWSYYLILTILFFWFGSTSFSSYEPMPVIDRMTLPSFPAVVILASYLVSVAWEKVKNIGPIALFSAGILLLSVVIPTLSYLYSSARNPLTETRVAETIKSELTDVKSGRLLLITSDQRSSNSLEQFFGYDYPGNLDVLSANADKYSINLLDYDKVFVYLNKDRSEFLASAYGQVNADDAIEYLSLPLVIDDGSIKLFSVPQSRFDELSALLRSVNTEGRND